MDEQIREELKEEKRKRRVKASVRMLVLGMVLGIVMCTVAAKFSGRILKGDDYRFFKEYKSSYGKYYDLMKFIEEKSLNDYKGEAIEDQVYRDIIASLNDPYAEYYTPEEYDNFIRRFSDSYVGIGIAVSDMEEGAVIRVVMKGCPAEEAGIKAGDVITKVDGKKIKDSTDATSRIAGEVGTEVKVEVTRDGETKEFVMNRAKIEEDSVVYSKIDKKKKIGYIYISMFKENTYKDFRNAVKDLKNDGYEKIVIDLRNNGGGSTVEAYKISDYLLPEGTIVYIADKHGNKKEVKSDSKNADIEYVMLVNDMTASASEIVACAVQDNKGGQIIGTKTFGKGVTQQTHELPDGSVVKITIEEYLRPSGGKVNGVGITPDIEVKDANNGDVIMEAAIKALSK